MTKTIKELEFEVARLDQEKTELEGRLSKLEDDFEGLDEVGGCNCTHAECDATASRLDDLYVELRDTLAEQGIALDVASLRGARKSLPRTTRRCGHQ